MNKPTLAKICGVLCILGAIVVFGWTLLDLGFGLTPEMMRTSISASGESSDKVSALVIVFSAFSTFDLVIVFGFAGFGFSGAFGEKLAGKIALGFIGAFSAINFLIIISGFIYLVFITDGSNLSILGFSFLVVPVAQLMLLAFGLASLIIGNAKILKSLIPFVVFILFLLIPIAFGGIAFLIGEISFLYDIATKATIPQWLMLGSVSWVLMGLAVFIKNRELTE